MAFIHLKDNTKFVTPPEQAKRLWFIKNGELKGTKAEQAYAKRIKRVILNWRSAPKSYLEANKDTIEPLASEHGVSLETKPEMWYDKL